MPTDPAAIAAAMPAVAANARHAGAAAKLLNCKADELVAKVTALSNTAAGASDAEKLAARVAELEGAAAEAKADAHIRENETRIQPVHRPMYREMLVKDFESTAKIIATLPEIKAPAAPAKKTTENSNVPDDVVKHYREALGTTHLYNKKKEA